MEIKCFTTGFLSSDINIVERKGIGHPDSLADLVAETFSKLYSEYTRKKFGVVLNHWVDKIVLRGGKANLDFGKAEIIEPIKVYLFGRTTKLANGNEIDLLKLLKQSVNSVFNPIFKNNICGHIEYVIDTNDSVGADHPKFYYTPGNSNELSELTKCIQCNDTVSCIAYAPLNSTEVMAIILENEINSEDFKSRHPYTGYDVKVMISGLPDGSADITVCIPFIAGLTPDYKFYCDKLALIKSELQEVIDDTGYFTNYELHINTKDQGKFAYLTVFGTALDKGDYGAVGRGNRRNGISNIFRGMSLEAFSGKNPVSHGGKLYNEIAQLLSNLVFLKFQLPNYVAILAKNGDSINNPSNVFVLLEDEISQGLKNDIYTIICDALKGVSMISEQLIQRDPLACFRNIEIPASMKPVLQFV